MSPPSLACVPVPASCAESSKPCLRACACELVCRGALRPLAEEGNGYTNICFSNKSFGLDAARVAERILMEV